MKPHPSEPSRRCSPSFLGLVFCLLSFILHSLGTRLSAAPTPTSPEDLRFFESRIRPALSDHCYGCHSSKASKVRGGLKLDSPQDLLKGGTDGPVLVPGHPEKSKLITAIQHSDPKLRMPRGPEGPVKLPAAVVADLTEWVRRGAPFPEPHPTAGTASKAAPTPPWAFRPLLTPPPPALPHSPWIQQPLDAFVLHELQKRGRKPMPPADKLALIRRATFDLTGLPPTPQEITSFLQDSSSNAWPKLVDRLLASPHYGEQWGRHWLDVVRYADTAGDTADYPVGLAWKYRNYVINAFNQDKPYNRFLQEQLAGDLLARSESPASYAESVKATGFIAISRRFGFDSENYHHLTIQDTLDTLGQAVLGISLGCARCHDHKFDPVSMQDYYALYGIFASTRYPFPGSEQKPRMRSMTPLVPPDQSLTQWRAYDQTLGAMSQWLASFKKSPPSATYRSLHDFDGDFETQKDAAGGSYGVIVPPWIAVGPLSVKTTAQSPYRNVYPAGKFGVLIEGGTNAYHLQQTLHLTHSSAPPQRLHLNLDFRLPNSNSSSNALHTPGTHRIQLTLPTTKRILAEILISPQSISLSSSQAPSSHIAPTLGEWNNLQLTLDWSTLQGSGQLTSTGKTVALPHFTLPQLSSLTTAQIEIQNLTPPSHLASQPLPALELDHFALQPFPLLPPSTQVAPYQPRPSSHPIPLDDLNSELRQRIGNDPDLEWQTEGSPPSSPWNPGPNSLVQVSTRSQTPFTNLFSGGRLGLHMPNRAAYDGTGRGIHPTYHHKSITNLHASFSFRCTDISSGGDGSWRFYIGHGAGPSAALQLFFNATQFFTQSDDQITPVAKITTNLWYQVQLDLNLTDRTYRGTLTYFGSGYPIAFSGKLSKKWDGTIDHTFVDSYGHIPGARPAIDIDQFVFSTGPFHSSHFPAPQPQWGFAPSTQDKTRVAQIREALAQATEEANRVQAETTRLLVDGPTEMAYAVTDGTWHDSQLQIRGEPDRPAGLVPRGFIQSLGGSPLPPSTQGSGRWELAQWLTSTNHPLTARVQVNRIWQHHFGHGIVDTPNDFGIRGKEPVSQPLLDHLATEFMQGGWSIKRMHRMIMLSSAYQQSALSPTSGDADAFHVVRRRLSAEEIRDAILLVSGDWDAQPGQEHPFVSPVSFGYTQHSPFSAVYDHNKRSVYLMVQRIKRHPFLALFDGPDPNASTGERRTTTVPTQALYFLNSSFVHEKSLHFAQRIAQNHPHPPQQIQHLFQIMLGRNPTPDEASEALQFLTDYQTEAARTASPTSPQPSTTDTRSLSALARSLMGSNEFLHVD